MKVNTLVSSKLLDKKWKEKDLIMHKRKLREIKIRAASASRAKLLYELPSKINSTKTLIKEFIQITRHNGIEVEILERDHNLGVAAAIISALDWFFEKERIGIILSLLHQLAFVERIV